MALGACLLSWCETLTVRGKGRAVLRKRGRPGAAFLKTTILRERGGGRGGAADPNVVVWRIDQVRPGRDRREPVPSPRRLRAVGPGTEGAR